MASRRVPGIYPPPGSSPLADAIRQRRGKWGLTGLDGALLHLPALAESWNGIGRALRNEGKLPDDIREAMILRVGALNSAAFEWMQHEDLGRAAGYDTMQLRAIRDTFKVLPSQLFTPLQAAAIKFADSSTKDIQVSDEVFDALKSQLQLLVAETDGASGKVQELLVESAAVVACYNMVSRFLMSLDIAGMSDSPPAWPTGRKEYHLPHPRASTLSSPQHLFLVTLTADPSLPWVLLANDLLTTHSLWDPILPYLNRTYNIILYDQRGHGKSSVPPAGDSVMTLEDLASDIPFILSSLPQVRLPIHSIVGVSQGGVTALNALRLYSEPGVILAKSVVTCSALAWSRLEDSKQRDEQIAMASSGSGGMNAVVQDTIERCLHAKVELEERGVLKDVIAMMTDTDAHTFILGAKAMRNFNLLNPTDVNEGSGPNLTDVNDIPVLLIAGNARDTYEASQIDHATNLMNQWKENGARRVELATMEDCGHLPMVEKLAKFANVVLNFLESVP